MLQQPRVIGQGAQVPQIQRRQAADPPGQRRRLEGHPRVAGLPANGAREALVVEPGDGGPLHAAAVAGGAAAERVAPLVVGQEIADGDADGIGIAIRHQHAPVVRQHLARVDVGRRDDGAARSHRVGQRARGALFGIQVGRDVDIGGAEELVQLVLFDEAVVEHHVLVDAELSGPRFEHQTIGLALGILHVRMGGAQHDVDRGRAARHDRRQRVDHVLDALVRREQPERQQDHPSLDAEATLALEPGRHLGDAVRNDVDAVRRDAVDV